MAFRTENKIFKDIKGIIDGFLSAKSFTDWHVVQGYQPRPFGLHDKLITISNVYTARVGWQGNTDRAIRNDSAGTWDLKHYERWREERSLQIDCFAVRNPNTDTLETIGAEDMASLVMSYLDSYAGTQALVSLGYGKLRIGNIRTNRSVNDSGLYEIVPGFDLVILYDQELVSEQIAAERISGEVHRI